MIGIAVAAVVAVIVPLGVIASTPAVTTDDSKLKVVASFFVLYNFARQVGGDRAEVTSIVPSGVEPHDWEPTIKQVSDANSADLFIYNGAGFESWAEDIEVELVIDTSSGLELMQTGEGGKEQGDEHVGADPHIWLDPMLAKQQVEKIRAGLAKADPDNVQYYNNNAASFTAALDALDTSIRSELSECEGREFIAFHNAFSYFAIMYGLTQHGLHGGLPESEVPPQRLQEIVDLANELKIDTIYSEELVDPRLAETIAAEIPNGRVLVLSPIEGLEEEDEQAGLGYIDKMEQNLVNLKAGLKCE